MEAFSKALDSKIENFPHIKSQIQELEHIKDMEDKKRLQAERNKRNAQISRDKLKV